MDDVHALTRKEGTDAGALPCPLAPARMHEAQGTGRRVFALWQAVRHAGPVFWLMPAHLPDMLLPQGLPEGVNQRLWLLRPEQNDLLWAVEEVLRSGCAGLVVAELAAPLSLTLGRRLQLGAKEGRTTALMLIREGAGSNAAETRWDCRPIAALQADSTRHHWNLIKNKSGTIGSWMLDWDGTTAAVDLVCKAGKRPVPPGAPG